MLRFAAVAVAIHVFLGAAASGQESNRPVAIIDGGKIPEELVRRATDVLKAGHEKFKENGVLGPLMDKRGINHGVLSQEGVRFDPKKITAHRAEYAPSKKSRRVKVPLFLPDGSPRYNKFGEREYGERTVEADALIASVFFDSGVTKKFQGKSQRLYYGVVFWRYLDDLTFHYSNRFVFVHGGESQFPSGQYLAEFSKWHAPGRLSSSSEP